MRIIDRMKQGIRSWLNIQESSPVNIQIKETLDYELNAIKNRVWYRGDSSEIHQLYQQLNSVDRHKFWASRSTPGLDIRKIHTGLPALMVDMLADVTLSGLSDFTFKEKAAEDLWKAIDKDNKFVKKLEKATKEVLYIGDGAFKITFDTAITEYPIIEFYPGDRIEIVSERGRIKEVIFKTEYKHNKQVYVLYETYGYGYIKNELTRGGKTVDLNFIPQTENLSDYWFSGYQEDKDGNVLNKGTYMLAVPIQFYESGKWDDRGQSIFDKKIDSFDSYDEAWSQWIEALRDGRSKTYIPESLVPRDPKTGALLKPNPFDNRFIKTESDMTETGKNEITLQQPVIPHDSYLATYITALDLCLQGVISPSTLGIDVKKLDNADAQREKEKATLYTRNTITNALKEDIPLLVDTVIKAYNEFYNAEVKDVEVEVDFGDYANPSFESQIETIGKGKTQGIMSIDACVNELYGDGKDEDWKEKEIERLKAEQGILEIEEPSVNTSLGGFQIEGELNGNNDNGEGVQDEPGGSEKVPGTNE